MLAEMQGGFFDGKLLEVPDSQRDILKLTDGQTFEIHEYERVSHNDKENLSKFRYKGKSAYRMRT